MGLAYLATLMNPAKSCGLNRRPVDPMSCGHIAVGIGVELARQVMWSWDAYEEVFEGWRHAGGKRVTQRSEWSRCKIGGVDVREIKFLKKVTHNFVNFAVILQKISPSEFCISFAHLKHVLPIYTWALW